MLSGALGSRNFRLLRRPAADGLGGLRKVAAPIMMPGGHWARRAARYGRPGQRRQEPHCQARRS
jgi:hypothetical protein